MAELEIDVLTPSETQGEDGMSQVPSNAGDIDVDCLEVLLESMTETHEAMSAEIGANAESAHSVVRHSGARKFNREDPMEAAAATVILKKAG